MKKALLLYFISSVAVLFSGCESVFDRRISEGVIEYDVTYPGIDPDNMLAGLMPNSMTMKFRKNLFNTELAAGMGMFKTNFVCNSNDYTLINTVKLINKKYATKLDKAAVEKSNEKYKNATVMKMDETKQIAGYNCHKALIVFDDVQLGSFYIYYTYDIKLKDPNWALPFKDIDGVMLEYQMEKYGIVMKFTARKITEAKVDDTAFMLPEDYEFITESDLDKEVNSIFETFKE